MDAVKEFNAELCSLYEIQPPVTKAKMSQITKTAIKALKFYKHVVQSVEKFIQKCRQEYKVPGLYIIDSIIRCSRKQFGPNKDMFAPRFSKNIVITFHNLFDCPPEDISRMIRVLNLWQKNGVYHPGIIQPLLDLASDPHNPAVFETVQKQVEQVTGLTPSMPLKCDQKPPALTADALQLGSGLDLKSDIQGDFSKVVNQLMQSMIPNPVPPLALNPQMHLQLLQQFLQLPVPMVPSASLLQNSMRLPSSSTVDSSLIGQIQMLTQQLLNQTAPAPSGQLIGLNAGFDHQFKQPMETPAVETEHFDDNYHDEELGEMSSLDKRIMYMCGEGEAKDETDVSRQRSLGDNDRSRKQSHSKKSTRAEFEERNASEADYGSDVANPSGTPNTPDHSSSQRSSPRRSSNYNDAHIDDGEVNVGYGRTPSSCLNMNNEEEEDDLHNGSGLENDSESRFSNGDFPSRSRMRSESSQRSHRSRDSRSKKSKRYEDEDNDRNDSRRSRKSKHKSRSDERSSKYNKSPAASANDGSHSDRSKHKKRSKHDSQNVEEKMERRTSRDDSKASESLKVKEASRKKHSSRTASSPDRKRRRTEFTVEYGIDEDDDDDDDVIFVDMQKKTVDVSRFLEKKLPSLKPKRKRASRSSSRGSSVEFISQDSNLEKPNKAKEFMPPSKPNMMSVCSTTLWIGHLNKLISEDELRAEIVEFGEVTINLVPPRGCAFITFSSRADAHKALDHLKNVCIQGNQLKVAWAAGVGIKNSPYYERYDIDHGVTYIQWSEIPNLDLPQLLDGSFIDEDSLPPNFDHGTLTSKKSKKKKTQQQDSTDATTTDATVINPSLIPLPQAVPPISSLPPPPLPPISSSTSSVSNSSQGMSLINPPHGINSGMPPLPPSTTCYVFPPGSAVSSSVNANNLSNNLLSSPMGLLKGMPHFDPSIPPPCLPTGMPPLPGSDNKPPNAVPFMPPTSHPTVDMMMRRIEIPPPVVQTSSEGQTNHSFFGNMDSVSRIPVVIHSHHDGNVVHQNSVPNSRTFMSPAILRGPSLNSNSSTIEKSQLPTTMSVLPSSTSSVLHPPPQMVLMEKPHLNLLASQHNFLIRQPNENKLTMPGSIIRPFRHASSSLDQPMVKVSQMVAQTAGDPLDQRQESTSNGNLVLGQRPRDVVQQNLVLQPHVMSVNQLRPNLYQPPPSSSLTNSMNHQDGVRRLPVPSEFLRRLGASTTSAPPQSNADNNASKQTPLLPIPQVNVPPPLLQVQSLSSMGGGPPQDGLVNVLSTSTMQNNEPQASSTLQDSKPQRKQPLLETPVTPKDNSFNSQLLHPSQIINMNHPAYNSLDHQKKDQNMPPPQMSNIMADHFKTPRPPRIGLHGEQFDGPENQHLNMPILLNFANPSSSSVTEALITEAIKSLSPLVRIPNPQECMGLLRSPLMNPASFLTGPHVLGNPRLDMRGMHVRSPGMRGPNNFKMGDRRNLLRSTGLNHQRSPMLRQRFPHNQQQ